MIDGGEIKAVEAERPEGVRVHETEGVIAPGLIDLHGHPEAASCRLGACAARGPAGGERTTDLRALAPQRRPPPRGRPARA